MILIGTEGALRSEPVEREVRIFKATGRQIIPIDFDGSLDVAHDDSLLSRHIGPAIIRIKESSETLKNGPPHETVDTIRRSFKLVCQDKKRARVFAATAGLMSILAAASVLAAFTAYQALLQERSARARLESRLSPRRIMPDQRECLASQLRQAGFTVGLAKWRDDETLRFAHELMTVLEGAGIRVRQDDFQIINPPTYGLVVAKSGSGAHQQLRDAFAQCGLESRFEPDAWGGLTVGPNEVPLFVGAKSFPFN